MRERASELLPIRALDPVLGSRQPPRNPTNLNFSSEGLMFRKLAFSDIFVVASLGDGRQSRSKNLRELR